MARLRTLLGSGSIGAAIKMLFAAVHESGPGTKRTCRGGAATSALEGTTDVPCKQGHFRVCRVAWRTFTSGLRAKKWKSGRPGTKPHSAKLCSPQNQFFHLFCKLCALKTCQ